VAARLLGLHPATLYRRVQAGRLALHRDGGRTYVLADELERYIASCDGPPTP
jgi:excisionase family DNA binding protein